MTGDVMSITRPGVGARFRRALTRLGTSDEELAAEDLREASEHAGCESIAGCSDREVVHVTGTVRTVTLQPRAGVPALEVEIFDGTAALVLVFIGRRRIAGIEPGRMLEATGRIAVAADRRVMFNPRYQLRPHGE
jgi:hypothetical protein